MYKNLSLLSPTYPFDLEFIAGLTQCEKGNYLDSIVDRQQGMQGYMLQLTTFLGMALFLMVNTSFQPIEVNYSYLHPMQFSTTIVTQKANIGTINGSIFCLIQSGING